MIKTIQSKEFILKIQKEKDSDKIYRYFKAGFDNAISFKTELYLFYVFILIGSQIVEFNPTLVGNNLSNFISTNNHGILVLIALDQLIGRFNNESERINKILKNIKNSLVNHHD